MTKITIPPVSGGFDLKTTVDARLQQIEDELNTKVLYKTNPLGEDNSLDNDIDMGGNALINSDSIQTQVLTISGNTIVVGDDLTIAKVTEVYNIAALRALEPSYNKQQIVLGGHSTADDGGGGQWVHDDSLSGGDNGGTRVVTVAGAVWIRVLNHVVTSEMFGGSGTSEIQSAVDTSTGRYSLEVTNEPTYDRTVEWKGQEHKTNGLPFKLHSQTITGGNLNARMTVANGMLYNCAFSNNKIEVFTLIDPRFPELVTSFSTSSQPRHIDIIGRHALVCCHGADKIEVYDLSNQTAPSLVGTITTGAGPKMFEISGNELFVVCNAANTIEKHKFLLPSDNSVFSSEKVAETTVTSPLCCAFNNEGLLAISGLDTNIRLVGSTSMNLIKTTPISGGGSHGTCVWINKTGVLITDAVQDGVHFVNYNDISNPSVDAFVSTVENPEQIEVVGNRCYIPGLATPAKMSVLDITDAAHPFEYKQVDLSVNGAGFTAYHQVGNNGYVYINGHFTPFNIDVIEVDVGQDDDTPKNVHENMYSRTAGFSDLTTANLIAHISSITETYRTALSNTAVSTTDNVIRLGSGADAALFDPATKPGKRVTITNVHSVSSSDVTNAFVGFSGTLSPLASVVLVSMDFMGSYQWDAVSSHGTIT